MKKRLSTKEYECLHWVGMGKTSEEIAIILEISRHTVNFHLRNAFAKLDAPNRPAAIAKAFHAAIFIPLNN